MCIAILNKSGQLIHTDLYYSGKNNSDGAGLCWVEDGKLKIFKSLKSDDIINMYYKIRKYNDLPILLHFRISTGGLINEDNCHPFFVNQNLAMCHNGTIYTIEKESQICDTRKFINNILTGLPENFLNNPALTVMIEKYIGNSKLVFLDNNGNYNILNESKGHWDTNKENWYSNDSYKVAYTKVTTYTYKYNDYKVTNYNKNVKTGNYSYNFCKRCNLLSCVNCSMFKDKCITCKDKDCFGCQLFKNNYKECENCKKSCKECESFNKLRNIKEDIEDINQQNWDYLYD